MFGRKPPATPPPDTAARLVKIIPDGPAVTLVFVRSGVMTEVTLYGAFGVDVAQLRKDLLE
jgi:hypothetical protein